jgi:hypothetical protein
VRSVPYAGVAAGLLCAAAFALLVQGLPRPGLQALATRAVAPYDGVVEGDPLQRVTCATWRRAGGTDRREVLAGLAGTVGGASTTGGVGATLPSRVASGVLDQQCATRATRHFLLYVIYARAAGFRAGP